MFFSLLIKHMAMIISATIELSLITTSYKYLVIVNKNMIKNNTYKQLVEKTGYRLQAAQ